MPLAQLIFPPPTPNGFEEWAFAHQQHHIAIATALRSQRNINLTNYVLYPINPNDFTAWLERHQQAHNEQNAALNVQGVDLSSLDPKNKKQLDSWMFIHYIEHRSADTDLKL